MARQFRPYPSATEDYCNYVSTVLPDGLEHQEVFPAVVRILQNFPDVQKEPTTLPPPRNHRHAIPLYADAQPVLFFVSKKNGELRLLADYRGLNSQTQPNKFLLPLVGILIDNMGKFKFSRLDLRDGFYQIGMAEEDTFKTSFSNPVALFGWTVMPVGLINAPASSQRVMSDLFKDLKLLQVCMDGIVIQSATAAMHHEQSRQVFQRPQDNEFRLSLSKCSFQASSIDFLGFEISAAGVQPLTAKISSIMSLPSRLSLRTAVR
ncbi:hypothetical protein Esti_005839 [Eimeria stiedai]